MVGGGFEKFECPQLEGVGRGETRLEASCKRTWKKGMTTTTTVMMMMNKNKRNEKKENMCSGRIHSKDAVGLFSQMKVRGKDFTGFSGTLKPVIEII